MDASITKVREVTKTRNVLDTVQVRNGYPAFRLTIDARAC
jgi:hypothetical protein